MHATEQAKALGIFGPPSFVVDGELFWEDDRLDEQSMAATDGKWPAGLTSPRQLSSIVALSRLGEHLHRRRACRVLPIVNANIHKESVFMSDEARVYDNIGPEFAAHGKIIMVARNTFAASSTPTPWKAIIRSQARHGGRLLALRRTPTAPLFGRVRFPLFEPSAVGIQDNVRSLIALKGTKGKRLTYRGAPAI